MSGRILTLALSAPLFWFACADAPTDDARPECQLDTDCPGGRVCRRNICIAGVCGDGGVCPPGTTCAVNRCEATGSGCVSDDQCPNGRCVDGECFQNACQDRETRPCSTACGDGVEQCRGGVWRGCNNQPVMEVCGDQRDNDCDQQIDEQCGGCRDGEERPCQTECGNGNERCLGGTWRGCTAPRVRQEQCGNGADEDCDGTIDEGCDGCADGDTRPCQTECGMGQEICREATWRECDAPVPIDEVCDNVDNDCDGSADEEIVRDCGGFCGQGVETCSAGRWVDCSAPENCNCGDGDIDRQVCGQCGFKERACEGGMFGAFGPCDESAAQCQPGMADETICGNCGTDRRVCTAACTWGDWQGCKAEGACAPGAVEEEACGMGCGTRSRSCTDACTWTELTECGGGGDGCAPGEMETRDCGACGEQTRVCGNDCAWADWSPCAGEGQCMPGDEEGQACGACGAQVRTCDPTCQWGDWGACDMQGQCDPGDTEREACGNCGFRERTCEQCVWSAWTACQGEGPCEPGDSERQACGESDVGLCQLGEQVRTCDGQCQWSDFDACRGAVLPAEEVCGDGVDQDCDGRDDRNPDRFEPNNSCDTCTVLNNGVDPNVFFLGTMDSRAEDRSDYFCFQADDALDPTEYIEVQLTQIPNGADYDIYLYRGRADCRARQSLDSSINGGSADDSISWGEGFNFDDSGEYVVEVRRAAGHDCFREYRLEINGLN